MIVRLPFLDHRRFAAWTVGSHHAWQRLEAGFVGKNQGAALLAWTLPQFGPHFPKDDQKTQPAENGGASQSGESGFEAKT